MQGNGEDFEEGRCQIGKEVKMHYNLISAVRNVIGILAVTTMLISCIVPSTTQVRTKEAKDPHYLTNKYLKDLKQGNNAERTEAAWKLGETYIKRTPEVVPALTEALKDPYPKVRSNAAGALSRIGEEARPAESALRESLYDPYGQAVLNAARALRSLKVPDTELIPAVRKVLNDKQGTTRVDAVRLSRVMGLKNREVIPTLASVLSDPVAQARKDAIKMLNEMKLKPVPKDVAGSVIELLKDSDEEVRWLAALFLGNAYIPIPAAKAPLIDALDDPSNSVVGYAARALGAYGKSAKNVVPKLIDILNTNTDESTRAEVCDALGRIGSPREKIADVLVEVLSSDPGPRARYRAASGLRDLKYKDKAVMNALKKAAAQDVDTSVRTISSITYKQLGGK